MNDKSRCKHGRLRFLGTRLHFGSPCTKTGGHQGRYRVHECTTCRARVEVGEVTGAKHAYRAEQLRGRRPIVPARPDVYVPVFDGVDAVDDPRGPERSIFDVRGGIGGVSDVDDVAAGTDWGTV